MKNTTRDTTLFYLETVVRCSTIRSQVFVAFLEAFREAANVEAVKKPVEHAHKCSCFQALLITKVGEGISHRIT